MADRDPPVPPLTQNQSFSDQVYREPLRLEASRVEPSHGLYQPSFALGEADWLRLQSSSSALTAAGSAVFSFGVAYALPVAVKWWLAQRAEQPVAVPAEDIWVAGITLVLGGLLLGGAILFSRDRRSVRKRINEHFESNPARLEYRDK